MSLAPRDREILVAVLLADGPWVQRFCWSPDQARWVLPGTVDAPGTVGSLLLVEPYAWAELPPLPAPPPPPTAEVVMADLLRIHPSAWHPLGAEINQERLRILVEMDGVLLMESKMGVVRGVPKVGSDRRRPDLEAADAEGNIG